ncbi:beta-glucosidase 25 [Iris pallida]|uniref:Beta-glucosidase 25 n=1 Tax=Iris pallida TaxID=29817 RepID=A0AAX6ET31_IRIPA|nr:beta-glucosidase 25 [Iris pallida]KAJ6825472.1 beta-glucosidase 25 [Iris pallida]
MSSVASDIGSYHLESKEIPIEPSCFPYKTQDEPYVMLASCLSFFRKKVHLLLWLMPWLRDEYNALNA